MKLCIPNTPPMAVATVITILRTKLHTLKGDDDLLIITGFK